MAKLTYSPLEVFSPVREKPVTTQLTTPRTAYKPFLYPWAYEAYTAHEKMHWLADEVPMQEDLQDWTFKLTEDERKLLTHLFRFFTQADVVVQNYYGTKLVPFFSSNPEIAMMLTSFGAREVTHVEAYSRLIETVGMPEEEYTAFLSYKEMSDKHDFLQKFTMDTPLEVAKTLAVFGAFTEGMQIFSSFAIMMNFPRFNKMKGMGQIVTWSSRDENMHARYTIRLFHQWMKETGLEYYMVLPHLHEIATAMVELEDHFLDLAFGVSDIKGLDKFEVKQYIRKVTNQRMKQLGGSDIYTIVGNPLPWLDEILYGVEHQNFFEGRATEYSKASLQNDLTEW